MLRAVSVRDHARITALALLVGIGVSGVAARATAQRPGAVEEITVADMALDWARGRFASPVICQIDSQSDGRPVRGLRRLLITPGPRQVRPRVNRIVFVDMEVSDASRCVSELAGEVPNVTGSIQIRLPTSRHRDTAKRDFRELMRRKGGIDFDIVSGGLKIQPITQPESAARTVDFRGGRASLHDVGKGSDLSRLLAPFDSPRKLSLEVSARDGTKLSFPLYMTDLR
jgi:hypothetical protein